MKPSAVPGPESAGIIERDHALLSSCMGRVYPLVMKRGLGVEVWDVDGNRYIDMMSGIAVTATGHSHPDVVQAIKDQADKFLHICFSDFYYEVGVQLAEKLAEIAPFAEPVNMFFANSGTETIEAALKLARYATERPNFIAFHGGFHGRTMGSLSLTASKYRQRQKFYPLMPGTFHVPYPNPANPILNPKSEDVGADVLNYIEQHVFSTIVAPGSVAAIVVEPIQGEGGYIIPPDTFLPGLRDLCDRHGILLIADEVQSGIGRTGKWWAIDHVAVQPDILTSAKGLASGMPIGAVIAREDLMTWEPGAHGSTFGGNPVACAAALKTLELVEGGYMENAARMGEFFVDRLNEMAEKHPLMQNVRGRGLMIGLDIVSPLDSISNHDLRDAIVDAAFNRGLLMLGAGNEALRLIPALMIDEAIGGEAMHLLDAALCDIEADLN